MVLEIKMMVRLFLLPHVKGLGFGMGCRSNSSACEGVAIRCVLGGFEFALIPKPERDTFSPTHVSNTPNA